MKYLKYGSKGHEVAQLQRALIAQGHLKPENDTADFDDATEAALTQYQVSRNLLADGIFGHDTRAALYGQAYAATDKRLKESDIMAAAALLQVEPEAIKAVVQVESAGRGYLKDGRVLILFERHKFYDLLRQQNPDLAKQIHARHPHICNPQSGGYIGKTGEYPRFTLAFSINPEAAMMSASWGLFQIMGFNYKSAGYDDVHTFVDAMKHSEGAQLMAFCRFVQAHKAMHTALRKHDWATFAKLYNGPAYRKNHYDSKLANAFARHQALMMAEAT